MCVHHLQIIYLQCEFNWPDDSRRQGQTQIYNHTSAFMSPFGHHPSLPSSHARKTQPRSSVAGSKWWAVWQPDLSMLNQPDMHTNTHTKQRSGPCQLGCGGQLRCILLICGLCVHVCVSQECEVLNLYQLYIVVPLLKNEVPQSKLKIFSQF